MRSCTRILSFFILILVLISKAYGQEEEKLTSRFYFPGLIGLNFIDENTSINYKAAITIISGMEYRPTSGPIFYRFNYDGTSTKYTSTALYLPTSVTTGTQHISNFLIGTGYRKKFSNLGAYALLQGGLSSQTYERVSGTSPQYTITQHNVKSFGLKLTGGFEYYIVPHFALITEISLYQNTAKYQRYPINNTQSAVSIGFTTTLF